MAGDPLKESTKYTIDGNVLMDIFNDAPWISKKINPSLWEKIEELIKSGTIISHVEVYKEIKKDGKNGEELYNWAQENKSIFRDHDAEKEGAIIRKMSSKYKNFVNEKVGTEYADPWLVAQAKVNHLTVISQEKGTFIQLCNDPEFTVRHVDAWDFIKEQGWKLQTGN